MSEGLAPLARPFLTVAETCGQLGIGRSSLYGVHVRRELLHPIKAGRKTLFDADEVSALVRAIKVGEVTVPSRVEP